MSSRRVFALFLLKLMILYGLGSIAKLVSDKILVEECTVYEHHTII